MFLRIDSIGSRAPKIQKTPGGGIRVDANLTRTGVFVYRQPNGQVVRELRHPDEVFKADSLATLEDAVLTIGHPGMVTPDTWSTESKGHVRNPHPEGKFVAGQLVVQEKKAVEGVLKKDFVELSCGYTCDVVYEKGTYDGEEYDARQTNIRYNHVGMGGNDWGRAGNEVKIRIDGKDTCFIRGMDLEQALAFIKTQETLIASIKADSEKLTARCDALAVDNERLKGQADAARADSADDKVQARVDAKVALIEGARKVLGSDKVDSKASEAALIVQVLSKHDAKFDAKGKSPEYLRARFDFVVESYQSTQGQLDELRAAGNGDREDSELVDFDKVVENYKKGWVK